MVVKTQDVLDGISVHDVRVTLRPEQTSGLMPGLGGKNLATHDVGVTPCCGKA